MLKSRSSRWWFSVTLLTVLLLSFLVTSPLFAYLYRATFTVAESGGTDYTALPVSCSVDVEWLVDNSFITTATALDTRVETFGGSEQLHMMASDRIMAFVPSLDGESQLNWYLTTGNTPLTSFPVIVGKEGYITTSDAAALELGTDFKIEFEGWLDPDPIRGPTIAATATSTEDAQTDDHTVDLPSGIEAGDLLLIIFFIYDPEHQYLSPTLSGWTTLDSDAENGYRLHIFYKVATGGEGSTVSIDTDGDTGYSSHQSFRITDYAGNPQCSSDSSGTSISPDAGSLATTFELTGDPNVLWITTFGGKSADITDPPTYPSGYTENDLTKSGAGVASLASATKISSSATENAGAFTVSDSINWMAYTIGIEGALPYLFHKEDSVELFFDSDDDLHAIVYARDDIEQTATTHTEQVSGDEFDSQRVGLRLDDCPKSIITQVSFYMNKVNNPTGTAYARVRSVSGDSVIGTLGTLDVSTLGAGLAWVDFTSDVAIPTEQDVRFTFEYDGGDAANYVGVRWSTGDLSDGYYTVYDGSWTDSSTVSWTIKVYFEDAEVIADDIVAGEYKVELENDGTDLTLEIDDVEQDSTSAIGAQDNSNDWIISIPYFNYYEHTVASTLIVDYEPVSYIDGTTLPDKEGAAQDGTITWGANPSGVTVTLGSMYAEETGVTVDEDSGGYQDAMPEVEVTDWFLEPDIGVALASHPLRPLVTLMSDHTTITELQAWRFLGLAILLLLTVAAAVMVRGHLLIAGLVCGGTIALLTQQTIWPGWSLVFIIPAIIAGLIAERTPSIG